MFSINMASNKHNTFHTPQKSVPPAKFYANRYKSSVKSVQMSSVSHSSQYSTDSPMGAASHIYCTPPQRFFKIKNPFEKTLIENLHVPICSPGMFKIRECESSGSFKWDIEHVSILKPADIVPCDSQFDPSPDPVLERKASEAIDIYFAQGMIVPSPLDEAPKRVPLPMDPSDEHTSTPEGIKPASREVWTQTLLSLPSNLPPEIENSLKAYYDHNKEQIGVGEADVSANGSLRRKLCFEEVHSDVEEELHESYRNISCPVFTSPCVNPSIHGHKRTYDLPLSMSNIPGLSKNICEEELIGFSPILKDPQARVLCGDREAYIKSPSLSPISKSPKEIVYRKPSPKLSPKQLSNDHHSYDASPFSQSTPEKTSSKSSVGSSPDIISESGSETHLQIIHRSNLDCLKFSEDVCEVRHNEVRIGKRSKSELSLSSLGRGKSAMKLDFNMDISSDVSMPLSGDHSLRCNSAMGGSDSSLSKLSAGNNWDMEMANFSMKKDLGSKELCEKYVIDMTTVQCDNKSTECDYESAIDNENIELNEICKYLTPTKSKIHSSSLKKENDSSCMIHSTSSPMQMSPINIEVNKHFSVEQLAFKSHNKTGFNQYDIHTSGKFTKALFNDEQFISPDVRTSRIALSRKDSGFNENLGLGSNSFVPGSDMTLSNTTKQIDITKSFNYNTEVSSVSWKRFDSGFNEETSDFSHQMSTNDVLKHPGRRYSPIIEYSENKKNVFIERYHNVEKVPHVQDSMSISDIFSEDMVSFNCNFSSTPSRSLRKNNK